MLVDESADQIGVADGPGQLPRPMLTVATIGRTTSN
jgi:hypothetical protein